MNLLSLSFLSCFFLFFLVYWTLGKTVKIQNAVVLLASSVLYITWSGFAFFLLAAVCVFSFYSAKIISGGNHQRAKGLLILSIVILVGILFIFKYYDFFAGEISRWLSVDGVFLSLVIPVGISFYTFTNVGYVIDVYRGSRKAEESLMDYLSFGTFFPLIMSGPIERSTTLLPQFKTKRSFDYTLAADGGQQILWGLFKKMVIADNCASVVNYVFPNYLSQPSSALIIGAVLYSFQIYFDFSGYSDIAIGLSKMLGFRVKTNFHYPYIALNISDFWRRWHMSLQRWFTDYIYFPLGGSRCSKGRTLFNTFVVFAVCGIWHGANWTFLVWGLYNAFLFIPYVLIFKGKTKKSISDDAVLPSPSAAFQILITFFLVTVGWIIFNSASMGDAVGYIAGCCGLCALFVAPTGIGLSQVYSTIAILFVVLVFEWVEKDKDYALQAKLPGWCRICVLYVLMYLLIFNRAGTADFIYLQF